MKLLSPFSFICVTSVILTSVLGAVVEPNGHGGAGPPGRSKCRHIDHRKEWRDLTKRQKQSYIRSVLCLQSLPPKTSGGVAKSRFDEFQASHIRLTDRIHVVGQFLPWHRHMVTLYSRELREKCGYNGPTPYWDWTRDADDTSKPISSSPLFDPITGFGGDGVPGTYTPPPDPTGTMLYRAWDWKGCVADGPFKDMVLHYGPGKFVTDHCLVRNFNESVRSYMTTESVSNALSQTTFLDFDGSQGVNSWTGIHLGGHFYGGGEVGDGASSPGDPLFYLHHAGLDRVWWLWQQANPSARLYDIAGATTQRGNDTITLDFVLDFPDLTGNVTVRELMDASKQPGCFKY